MEQFLPIHVCEKTRFRLLLNVSNSDVLKKFNQISRNKKQKKKFILVIEALKKGISNRTQYNFEATCKHGDIYAIKVDEHRFYTIENNDNGYKELYITRYGKKESEQNDKKLNAIINSIGNIEIQNFFENE